MTDHTADAIRPIVEFHIGAHLAAQADSVTRYGVEDAAGTLHDAFGPDDALAIAVDPDHRHGPQPRRAVWWVETRSPRLPIQPATAESRAAA